MNITFSTCWYNFKAKFGLETYMGWIDNFLSNVESCYLVVYTDETGLGLFSKYFTNPNIKFIVKPVETFYNYRYREFWIRNHEKNTSLNTMVDWRVNMVWSEKVHFVNETIKKQYFPETNMYGWCDIGYFRNENDSISGEEIKRWPCKEKIENLNKAQIYYAMINNNNQFLNQLVNLINTKNENGLPKIPIPPFQISISGGFFLIHKNNIDKWAYLYDHKLQLYIKNNYLVKDDQIILADCMFSKETMNYFTLVTNKSVDYDWFMFQRTLLH